MNRIWLFILLACLLPVLLGCGGGCFAGLTGGSIPIGDVDGRLYAPVASPSANSPAYLPQPNYPVTLLDADGQVLQQTLTDAEGYFSLRDIPQGQSVLVAGELAGQFAKLDLNLTGATRQQVQAQLLLTPVPTFIANTLLIQPITQNTVLMSAGNSRQFTADVVLGNRQFQPVPASWAVISVERIDGKSVGAITQDGLFTALNSGTCFITVQFRDLDAQLTVNVL